MQNYRKNHFMHRFFVLCVAFSAMLSLTAQEQGAPRNIILCIGDGMGLAQVHASAIQYGIIHGQERPDLSGRLVFEDFPVIGYQVSSSANALVTDSAASGTALACGGKTNNGVLGQDAEGNPLLPVSKVALQAGKTAGVLTSVTLDHATPAAFYACVPSRTHYDTIVEQAFQSGLTVLGGNQTSSKKYVSEALQALCTGNGWNFVDNAALAALTPASATDHNLLYFKLVAATATLDYSPGRQADFQQLRLADVAAKTVDILLAKGGNKGFFLMIEGGAIDHAGHANDQEWLLAETLEFDLAIRTMIERLEAAGELEKTLIVVTADHETGGMGLNGPGGIPGTENPLQSGWTTKGHTAVPPLVWARGPASARFAGKQDNTDIAKKIKSLLK